MGSRAAGGLPQLVIVNDTESDTQRPITCESADSSMEAVGFRINELRDVRGGDDGVARQDVAAAVDCDEAIVEVFARASSVHIVAPRCGLRTRKVGGRWLPQSAQLPSDSSTRRPLKAVCSRRQLLLRAPSVCSSGSSRPEQHEGKPVLVRTEVIPTTDGGGDSSISRPCAALVAGRLRCYERAAHDPQLHRVRDRRRR